MKSAAPWSVKGIERDARETAKEAAKREGMTVGEWLNHVIYTAGEGGADVDGLKLSDVVTAIEMLSKKVAGAEEQSVEAVNDLARNFGGVVERLQRLERSGAAGENSAGVDSSVADRLQRLEAKSNDNQRIEALKALEKAVAQVATQFSSAHKTSLARLDSSEKQIQQLASRLDQQSKLGSASSEADTAALDHLNTSIEGLAARISRAEKIASEASQMKSEVGDAADAEFVERTGKRLRVLGDEIKRGGDQIRALETSIDRLSEQIDAAERRSSEGVQKVSETINELREQLLANASQGNETARADIEDAVSAATEKTESRITDLQRSLAAIVAKLDKKPALDLLDDDEPSAQPQAFAPMPSATPEAAHETAPTLPSEPAFDEPAAPTDADEGDDLHAELEKALAEVSFDDDDAVDVEESAAADDDAALESLSLDAAETETDRTELSVADGEDEEDPFAALAELDILDDEEVSGGRRPEADTEADDNASADLDDANDFSLDGLEGIDGTAENGASEASSVLDDVRAAFGMVDKGSPSTADAASATTTSPASDDLDDAFSAFDDDQLPPAESSRLSDDDKADDVMAALDDLGFDSPDEDAGMPPLVDGEDDDDLPPPPFGKRQREEAAETPNSDDAGDDEPGDDKADFLKAARAAAREAAAKAALESGKGEDGKRKLSPRQRAALAAKIKKKKEEAQKAAHAKTVEEAAEKFNDADNKDADKPSPLGKVMGLLKGKGDQDSAEDTAPASEDAVVTETTGGRSLLTSLPVAIAIVTAIALIFAAWFFMQRGGSSNDNTAAQTQQQQTTTQAPQTTSVSAPAQQTQPAAPAEPEPIQPRALFVDAMTAFNEAITNDQRAAAIETLEQAAALGHPPAQLQLGELYKAGEGVDQDMNQAWTWYERAANGGNVMAMHRLGVMAARGDGVPLDYKLAISWFEKASSFGLVDSQYNLGATFHPSADGDPAGIQDREKAFYWYSLAAFNGDNQAETLANGVGAPLTPDVKRRIKAEIEQWIPERIDSAANERIGS